jgi:hypothetical protein
VSPELVALVKAIQRAHVGDQGPEYKVWGSTVHQFTVRDVFEFAAALMREGVTVAQDKAA